VFAGIAHQLRRRIKTHGLGVQDGGAEDIRIISLQPTGGIDEQCEGGRMAFRKTIFAKALNLPEAALGEVGIVTIADHAINHLLLEGMDGADPTEGRHGPTQPVRFPRRETGRRDGDLHRLFLEQRHAKRPFQHHLQLLARIIDRPAQTEVLPPLQIGVYHVALNRPWPDNRHLDHQIIKASGLEARQHAHLGPALDLEHADRVGAADHVIDFRLLVLA